MSFIEMSLARSNTEECAVSAFDTIEMYRGQTNQANICTIDYFDIIKMFETFKWSLHKVPINKSEMSLELWLTW